MTQSTKKKSDTRITTARREALYDYFADFTIEALMDTIIKNTPREKLIPFADMLIARQKRNEWLD